MLYSLDERLRLGSGSLSSTLISLDDLARLRGRLADEVAPREATFDTSGGGAKAKAAEERMPLEINVFLLLNDLRAYSIGWRLLRNTLMTWHFDILINQITARRTFCANRSATLVLMPDVRIAVVRGCAFAHLHAESRSC